MNVIDKILKTYNKEYCKNPNEIFLEPFVDNLIEELMQFNSDIANELEECNCNKSNLDKLDKFLKINSLLYQMYRDEIFWDTLNKIKIQLEILNADYQS